MIIPNTTTVSYKRQYKNNISHICALDKRSVWWMWVGGFGWRAC